MVKLYEARSRLKNFPDEAGKCRGNFLHMNRPLLDNKCYKNDTDITNALNKHFRSVGDNNANKTDAAKTHFSAFLQNPSPNTFFLKQVEEHEVLQQIQNLKLKKSPRHDGIKPSIIKAAYEKKTTYPLVQCTMSP